MSFHPFGAFKLKACLSNRSLRGFVLIIPFIIPRLSTVSSNLSPFRTLPFSLNLSDISVFCQYFTAHTSSTV